MGTSPFIVGLRRYRAARNAEMRRYWANLRKQVLECLGKKCVRCGYTDARALHVDHAEGNGTSERRRFGSPNAYYRHVLANPSGYQVLCANCNAIKQHEQKEYAHKNGRPRYTNKKHWTDIRKWGDSSARTPRQRALPGIPT